MSEYQYYEFQAIDRPLSEQEMRTLRAYSTRATITPTHFSNHYEWGSFKGNPAVWIEKYFDAFFYFANWHTYELMFRLPRRALDMELAKQYCRGRVARARSKGDFVILEFLPEDEQSDDGSDDGSGWLSSLLPLRSDLISGDFRMLYLAWLLSAQVGELDDETPEPQVPPGLGTLTASLKAFAEFLRLDRDLIAAAAASSPAQAEPASEADIAGWLTALPESEKTDWLLRLVNRQDTHLRAELLKAFLARRGQSGEPAAPPRRVIDILEAAEQHAETRKKREAERAARERMRRDQEAAAAREKHLANLAKREPEAWRQVDALIATKRPGEYDAAVQLLTDLADLGQKLGRHTEVRDRLARLRQEHARKPTLLTRLKAAGLLAE
ncbi:MAG TPA: hypothetical protein VLM91_06875 [Candidatus Methylomirabilis sp.]|nr:hypothetical protein [Candidatus Methylomirabilis sp.]